VDVCCPKGLEWGLLSQRVEEDAMRRWKLLGERRFGPLFWTQFFGALNDNLFKTSFIFLVTFGSLAGVHDDKWLAPVLNGLLILPFFLFSATAGQIADKWEKARLIRWVKLWELGVMSLAGLGFVLQNVYLLAGALFLMGTQSAFFGPLKYGVLPQMLENDELVVGNAIIGSGTFLAILIGTLSGGLLLGASDWAGPVVTLAILGIAVAGYWTSRRIPNAPASNAQLELDWNPLRQTLQVLRYAMEDRTVFRSILGVSWFWFFGASLLTLFPIYGRHVLQVDERVVTLFLAEFCLGIGVGAFVCARLAQRRMELGLVPLGALGLGVFLFDLVLASSGWESASGSALLGIGSFLSTPTSARILVDLFFIALCGGCYVVPLNAMTQSRARPERRSRILAAGGILSALFMVGSAALTAGLAAVGVSTLGIYLVLVGAQAVLTLYIFNLAQEPVLRLVVHVLVRAMYRLRVAGLEHVPESGPVLVASNHVTYVDGLILSAALARPVRFVAYYRFLRYPILGAVLRRARVIPIAGARENAAVLREALREIERALRGGEVVCIFPEGSLTRDGELSTFRRGIERIVARTPVPVVPLSLGGLWGSFFSRARARLFGFFPTRMWPQIAVMLGSAIPPHEVTADRVREHVAALCL
jgi:1-acyl-sn-glycerol-3-phosphate acyltransferase